jgi:hypothetical protein
MKQMRWYLLAGAALVWLCGAPAARAQANPAAPAPPDGEASVPAPPDGEASVPAPPDGEPSGGAAASGGPVIEMPPEEPATGATASAGSAPLIQLGVTPPADALNRGLTDARLAQPSTVVGGYGQFSLNALKPGNEEWNTRASVRRLVLFVAHPITDDIRVYTELEWENSVACSSCAGSAEVEQAFVQAPLLGDALSLRAGLMLVPMGIINQWHEPPVFHGVERPNVDNVIIPSTWRELGAGITGNLASQVFRYELYLTTTLDPLRLSENGLGGARTLGSLAPAKAFAVSGRAEVEPVLGAIAGASFFLSDLGANGDYYRESGKKRSLRLPLLGYAVDARMRRWGFEARVLWSQFFFPNAEDLVAAYREDGSPLFPREATEGTVPSRIQGGYIELAYDALSLLHVSHQLLAFVRLETYDSQAAVPNGYKRNPNLDIDELTLGLTYRPVTQLVFKTDLQLRDRRYGYDQLQYNLGFGYMF